MKVPPLDLPRQFESVRGDVMRRIDDVFATQRFILGPMVEELEREIANLCGAKHGIGVASGSDALLLSLMALGIKAGDVVVTTPFSFFSTVSSITRLGARPLFVDIEPDTMNLDPDLLAQVPLAGVKAVLPIHLFGQLARMEEIASWAHSSRVAILEDAAQAIGASRLGRPAGNWGKVTGFSFYPTKNLGAAGDGGMIVTLSDEIATHLRSLRDHGAKRRYFHDEVGLNSRLDAIQAAVLLAKLPHLKTWNEERRRLANLYRTKLAGLPLRLPSEIEGNYHIYHQFVVRVPERRDELKAYLLEREISTEIYYPLPLHKMKVFAGRAAAASNLEQAEKASQEVLSLPIEPLLGEREQLFVCQNIRELLG